MATTLASFLFEDDTSLFKVMSAKFAKYEAKAWRFKGKFQPTGGVGDGIAIAIGDDDDPLRLTVLNAHPRAVENVLHVVQGRLVSQFGDGMTGRLRFEGRCTDERNDNRDAWIDLSRVLADPLSAGGGEPNIQYVKQQQQLDRIMLTTMTGHLTTVVQALVASNNNKDNAIATLSTARAPATAGSDIGAGGISALVGVAAFLLILPLARAQLGLRPTAGIGEVLVEAQRAFGKVISAPAAVLTEAERVEEHDVKRARAQLPPREALAPGTPEIPDNLGGVLEQLRAADLDPVFAELAKDPEAVARLVRKLGTDPATKSIATRIGAELAGFAPPSGA
jgi:hypothetical protein